MTHAQVITGPATERPTRFLDVRGEILEWEPASITNAPGIRAGTGVVLYRDAGHGRLSLAAVLVLLTASGPAASVVYSAYPAAPILQGHGRAGLCLNGGTDTVLDGAALQQLLERARAAQLA